MRLLIDSNRYTDFDAGVPEVTERFGRVEELWFSVVVMGELRAGFTFGSRQRENEENLDKFLYRPNVTVLKIDEETTDHYAHIYSILRRQGALIPTNDMWIAAQARQHDLTLDTRDDHFKRVPGLKLFQ